MIDGTPKKCRVFPMVEETSMGLDAQKLPALALKEQREAQSFPRLGLPLLVAVILLAAPLSAAAQRFAPDSATTDTLFQNAFGQYAAARVCGERPTISQARDALFRILNWHDHNRYNLRSVQMFNANPERLLSDGERRYREQRWMSCSQVRDAVRQLDDITRRFP